MASKEANLTTRLARSSDIPRSKKNMALNLIRKNRDRKSLVACGRVESTSAFR